MSSSTKWSALCGKLTASRNDMGIGKPGFWGMRTMSVLLLLGHCTWSLPSLPSADFEKQESPRLERFLGFWTYRLRFSLFPDVSTLNHYSSRLCANGEYTYTYIIYIRTYIYIYICLYVIMCIHIHLSTVKALCKKGHIPAMARRIVDLPAPSSPQSITLDPRATWNSRST